MPDAFIWPAVAIICILILGTIALILLRPALLRLVDRTSKADKDGLTFERTQERGAATETSVPLVSFDDLMKHPVSASILERERYIKTKVQEFKLKTDAENIDVLIRALADTQLGSEFNKISYAIFGSQINLLNKLAGSTQGISSIGAETIFIQAQNDFPTTHGNRTFQEWLNYLLSYNLIIQNTDRIDITQYGSDFLKHLIDTRQVYERHG